MSDKLICPGFETALADLLRWFDDTSTKAMIIGGIAVSLVGQPRTTQDIDSLISIDFAKLASFYKRGDFFGFTPRLSDALDFARKNRVLLMKHAESQIDVDISLAGLPFEQESFKRLRRVKTDNIIIPVPTPEDLIIMKAVAHRSKDLVDIASILEATKKIDAKRIRKWVKEFADALGKPDLYEDIAKLLKARSGL